MFLQKLQQLIKTGASLKCHGIEESFLRYPDRTEEDKTINSDVVCPLEQFPANFSGKCPPLFATFIYLSSTVCHPLLDHGNERCKRPQHGVVGSGTGMNSS